MGSGCNMRGTVICSVLFLFRMLGVGGGSGGGSGVVHATKGGSTTRTPAPSFPVGVSVSFLLQVVVPSIPIKLVVNVGHC